MLAEGLALTLTLSRPVPAKAGMGEGTWLRLGRFRIKITNKADVWVMEERDGELFVDSLKSLRRCDVPLTR